MIVVLALVAISTVAIRWSGDLPAFVRHFEDSVPEVDAIDADHTT